jgi:Cellulase (glycosyl hydrolase family 5)
MVYRPSWAERRISALLLGLLFMSSIAGCIIVRKLLPSASPNIAYGVNVDITAMIPGTPYTVKTASGGNFFDLAAQLGINTLRITDIQWETSGKEYSSATWRFVFDEAERHHLHVILLLEDGGEYSALQQAHTLLGRYGLAHAPALWLVDLYNEPNLSDPLLMNALHEEAAYVRRVAPRVPITIGGWKSEIPDHSGKFDWQDPLDIPKFIKMVDIVSPHLYEFEQGARQGFSPRQWTQHFLNAVHQEALHKSILLEEFGAANGLAPTNESVTTGSPSWQASVFRGVLQETAAEYDQGVIGALAWIIAPRPTWSYPHNYEKNMVGWAFVLNRGQHLLPAAREFSAAAHYGQREILLL